VSVLRRLLGGQATIDRRIFVLLYALVLAALAAGLVWWVERGAGWERPLDIPWALVVAAFFAVEATALHIELRKETHSLSLSGLPLLIGVLSLSPAALIAARLLGSGLALVVVRRGRGVKLIWNLSLFGAEAATVVALASRALGDGPLDSLGTWLVLLVAALVGELVGLLAVPLVIMIAQSEFQPSLFAQIGRSQLVAGVASSFAVVMAAAMVYVPSLAIVGLVPVLAVAFLLRLHGRLGKEHHDLQQIHGFTRAISGRDSLDTGLRELCTILRMRGAAVVVQTETGEFAARAYCDDTLQSSTLTQPTDAQPTDDPQPTDTAGPVDGLTVVKPDSSSAVADLIRQFGGSQGLGLSIADGPDEQAYLLAFDRLGATEEIGEDERTLFESMASTLGVRLSADRLLDRLETQARFDTLTGLANRQTLEQLLDDRLQEPSRPGAVLLLDLDRFKDVNDSLGHTFGDEVLRRVAVRLTEELQEVDTAARLAGDEFAVLLDHIDGGDDLPTRVERLVTQLSRPLDVDGVMIEVGVSVGSAQWPTDAATAGDLLRLADIAMYEAKRTHQQWARFDVSLDHANAGRLALMGELREAIRTGQLQVYLQPQHRAGDHRLVAAEALVRWIHPGRGMIPPNDFIPLAEHSSLAGDLTRSVLNQALEASRQLAAHNVVIPISVNLTSRDLLDRKLPGAVADALRAKNVSPEHLFGRRLWHRLRLAPVPPTAPAR